MERCLRHAGAPLLEMVRRWLFEGRLANTPGDFFITASPDPCSAQYLPLPYPRLTTQCRVLQQTACPCMCLTGVCLVTGGQSFLQHHWLSSHWQPSRMLPELV